jgi:hypothetical protein
MAVALQNEFLIMLHTASYCSALPHADKILLACLSALKMQASLLPLHSRIV